MSPHPRWADFGNVLRAAREAAGISLRQAEQLSGYSRGMLSFAETGTARPGRGLVRWYDGRFRADGALVAAFEQLRAADDSDSEPDREPDRQPDLVGSDAD